MYKVLDLGTVSDVMQTGQTLKDKALSFVRGSHHSMSTGGVSYLGIGVIGNLVVVIAGPDGQELADALQLHSAWAAEVLRLENLH